MATKKKPPEWKMRVSFDLDEVLFVSPVDHKTEPPLRFPFNLIFRERLRLGTPLLISELQKEDTKYGSTHPHIVPKDT